MGRLASSKNTSASNQHRVMSKFLANQYVFPVSFLLRLGYSVTLDQFSYWHCLPMPSGHLWEGWNCKIASAADRHWLMSKFLANQYVSFLLS